MIYHLGVDLGTTYTAAAVARNGHAEPVTLGTRSVAVPSVVYLNDNDLVVGQPAVRRAASEPSRVAREFKRRVGDPTPLLVGGSPMAAEMLMARLLAWVVEQVATTEGGPPASLAVTHPANWGEYKLDLFRQAIRHVGLQADHFVPEPVAAATFYASQRELAPGSIVAVYDLGGGTFDAALVRSEGPGFGIIGRPDGIERLGGVDFDHAVLRHVADVAGIDLDGIDAGDTAMWSALTQLRQGCVEAKEALSAETHVSIPVMLPTRHTEVRLTRSEFEAMIGPALDETLVALRRAIASAGVTPEQVTAVLLVGGSSRIPLLSQRVTAELNLPVAVDARPKDAIPLGAALAAAHAAPQPAAPQPSPTSGAAPVVMATQPLATPGAGAPVPAPQPGRSGSTKPWWIAAAAGVVAILALAALAMSNGGGGGSGQQQTGTTTDGQGGSSTPTSEDTNPTTGGDDSQSASDVLGDVLDDLSTSGSGTDSDGSSSSVQRDALPGSEWSDDARAQFVTDCSADPVGQVATALKEAEEFCGCIYDDVSASDTSFEEFNHLWVEDADLDTTAGGSAMKSAMMSCLL